MGFIKTVAGRQNQNILLTLYRSLVLPIIDFCSPVWFVYRKNHIIKLETIQRRATCYILGQNRGDQSYSHRLQSLNLMDLSNRRKYLTICFASSCRPILNTTSFIFSNWTSILAIMMNFCLMTISLQKQIVTNILLLSISLSCGQVYPFQLEISLFCPPA